MIKKMVVLSVDITEKQGVTALHPAYLHQIKASDISLAFIYFIRHTAPRNRHGFGGFVISIAFLRLSGHSICLILPGAHNGCSILKHRLFRVEALAAAVVDIGAVAAEHRTGEL